MSSLFEYERDAVRVRARFMNASGVEESRKFSVDPNLTSFEILTSLLSRAFELNGEFSVSYLCAGEWLPLLSDWDLDAAILSASDPYLIITVVERHVTDIDEDVLSTTSTDDMSASAEPSVATGSVIPTASAIHSIVQTSNQAGVNFFKKHYEKTLPTLTQKLQRALNITEESLAPRVHHGLPILDSAEANDNAPPRGPVVDREFSSYLNKVGELIRPRELRLAVYQGGVEASLRKVVWKHLLGVYPMGLNGKERIDYMKRKSFEYQNLKQTWMDLILRGRLTDDIKFITNMVRKDVLRTDRHHHFYAGEGNENITTLFNILTTYALNHPSVSYCQGMSDLLSPILVTMQDEAHSYIAFAALMKRMKPNFLLDGKAMTKKFQHLSEGLMYYDPEFFTYLKLHHADDLLFCYRWLLLEMKREFAFEDACRSLEVLWSSLPPTYPIDREVGLALYEVRFAPKDPPKLAANESYQRKETVYTKVMALRKRTNSTDDQPKKLLTPVRKAAAKKSTSSSSLLLRNRIRSAGSAESDGYTPMSKSRSVMSDDGFGAAHARKTLKSDAHKDSIDEKEELEEHAKKKVTNLKDFYKLADGEDPPKEEEDEGHSSSTEEGCETPEDPFEDVVGYSQANGNNLAIFCNRLPPPTEFGDGNPFLMFLCIACLLQHRAHIMRQKLDYQEIAMYFDKMIRRHPVEKTLNLARKLFAEYLNEDWAAVESAKDADAKNC